MTGGINSKGGGGRAHLCILFLRLGSNVNSSKEKWQCNVLFMYQFDTYDYIHPVCVQSNQNVR